jgi:hypothetical protein
LFPTISAEIAMKRRIMGTWLVWSIDRTQLSCALKILVDLPGTAPGSNPSIPRRVYHHSHRSDPFIIGQAGDKRKGASREGRWKRMKALRLAAAIVLKRRIIVTNFLRGCHQTVTFV